MQSISRRWAGICAMLLFISISCSEDVLDNLTGTWTFGSAFVDGVGTNAVGTIEFSATNRGSADLFFLIGTDTIRKQGAFTYSQTEERILVDFPGENIAFTRRENRGNQQELEFVQALGAEVYTVVFDLIPD